MLCFLFVGLVGAFLIKQILGPGEALQVLSAGVHRRDKIRLFPCLHCSFATVLCTTLILSQIVKAKYSE